MGNAFINGYGVSKNCTTAQKYYMKVADDVIETYFQGQIIGGKLPLHPGKRVVFEGSVYKPAKKSSALSSQDVLSVRMSNSDHVLIVSLSIYHIPSTTSSLYHIPSTFFFTLSHSINYFFTLSHSVNYFYTLSHSINYFFTLSHSINFFSFSLYSSSTMNTLLVEEMQMQCLYLAKSTILDLIQQTGKYYLIKKTSITTNHHNKQGTLKSHSSTFFKPSKRQKKT